MERKCELCSARAALYCAADEAYVCWECDSNVHGANFLVARHYRSVLCRQCSSPTLWRASGARFHPTTCLCSSCQAENRTSSQSLNKNNKNQTESAVLSSAVLTSQDARVRETNADGPRFYRVVKSSSKVCLAFDCRPRSPVSVISSERTLVKKQRQFVLEQVSAESSSDSDPEEL